MNPNVPNKPIVCVTEALDCITGFTDEPGDTRRWPRPAYVPRFDLNGTTPRNEPNGDHDGHASRSG
jgi:hypothetical protein